MGNLGINCGKNAAAHRHQMRRKLDSDGVACNRGKFLFDFRRMPVGNKAIGLEIVRNLAKQRGHRCLAARAAGAGFGIDNYIFCPDQIILERRVKAKNN